MKRIFRTVFTRLLSTNCTTAIRTLLSKTHYLLACILILLPTLSLAYESSEPVSITQLRPVVGNLVYFHVDAVAMCGTSAFRIKLDTESGKAMYSAMLSAAMSGKKIVIETWGECAENGGWGTEVQGVTILIT